MVNALTIDVEDYFQVSAFEQHIDRRSWSEYPSRVAANTRTILELLESRGVKATFFVLAWVAERFPDLIREISGAGHEIGSHSYWHRLVYDLQPAEFREDLRQSKSVLEEIIGGEVRAFRAPSFSIVERSKWALDVLVEEGFRIDSSIFPVYHDRYGIPGAPTEFHRLQTQAGPLWECPPSVVRFGRLNIPVSGGGYFRLFPLSWTLRWLERINRRQQQPFVFYFHPWELDAAQPRLKAGTRLSRFRHYVNLTTTRRKLTALLERFSFAALRDVLGSYTKEG